MYTPKSYLDIYKSIYSSRTAAEAVALAEVDDEDEKIEPWLHAPKAGDAKED